jgi:hypothetical protein
MHIYVSPTNHIDTDVAIRNPSNTGWIDIGDAFVWDDANSEWVPTYQRKGYGAAADTVNRHLAIALFPSSLLDILGHPTNGFTVKKLYPTEETVNILSQVSNNGGMVVFELDTNYDQDSLLFVEYDANVGSATHDGVAIPSFKRRIHVNIIYLDGSRQLDGTWQLNGGIV